MISLDMNLPIPVVGVDPGPDWALNINSCLTIIDSHDHTSGKGIQITPNGLNINTDLSFAGNNATNLRSTRFIAQGSPLSLSSDLGCLYVSGSDLYFNDASGNQIRMTIAGGVNGSPGSISNLIAPASATYVSGTATFVWQSAVNVAANMDNASVILRNQTINSKGLTLSPPNAMGSDYSIVLPFLPVSQSIMTIDASGNIATPGVYPITGSSIANNTITSANIAPGTIVLQSQKFLTSSTWTAPTNVSSVIVYGCGGGGGGGAGVNTPTAAGGGSGGSGAIGRTALISVTPGNTYTITVGAGGAASSFGGDSSFGSLITFRGAKGGANGGGSTGWAGNVDTTYSTGSGFGGGSSSSGGTGSLSSGFSGGTGGTDASNGGGGGGGGAGESGNGANGGNGGFPVGGLGGSPSANSGGGGGGGGGSVGSSSGGGGAGGSGFVIVSWV